MRWLARGRARQVGVCVATFAAGSLLAACGSSNSTHAERQKYIARVNAECKAFEEKILTLDERLVHVEKKIREGLVLAEQSDARLRAIPVPKGEKVPREWLSAREAVFAATKRLIYAHPASVERQRASKEEVALKGKARALAQAYGLVNCIRIS
jgi:hypothetical protein